ncbi:energy transducer TonB [Rhodopila sp.]|uniref:energy transducer TonB n=1 Tax=Rhodopila sp. TaxID=2480087 RepID=UPI003D0A3722
MPALKDKRRGRPVSPRRRFVWIALGLSVAVHIVAALLIVLLPRVLPKQPVSRERGTVELLMVEQKGAQPGAAPRPAPKQVARAQPRPARPAQPPAVKPAAQPPAVKPAAAQPPKPAIKPPDPAQEAAGPMVPRSPDVAAPKPAEAAPPKPAQAVPATAKAAEATPRPAQPPPAARRQAPVFDLAGTDSESNAVALGPNIVPASPDDRFRNRPPIYPPEAEIRGEHGTVLVMIHVSEDGLASSVDVAQSSGVEVLDRAAVDAVRKWRFRPAVRQGRAVPFDMPFRFVFEAN